MRHAEGLAKAQIVSVCQPEHNRMCYSIGWENSSNSNLGKEKVLSPEDIVSRASRVFPHQGEDELVRSAISVVNVMMVHLLSDG